MADQTVRSASAAAASKDTRELLSNGVDNLCGPISLVTLANWISSAHFYIQNINGSMERDPTLYERLVQYHGVKNSPDWGEEEQEGFTAFLYDVENRLRDAREELDAGARDRRRSQMPRGLKRRAEDDDGA
jgi:hypothetical protein